MKESPQRWGTAKWPVETACLPAPTPRDINFDFDIDEAVNESEAWGRQIDEDEEDEPWRMYSWQVVQIDGCDSPPKKWCKVVNDYNCFAQQKVQELVQQKMVYITWKKKTFSIVCKQVRYSWDILSFVTTNRGYHVKDLPDKHIYPEISIEILMKKTKYHIVFNAFNVYMNFREVWGRK